MLAKVARADEKAGGLDRGAGRLDREAGALARLAPAAAAAGATVPRVRARLELGGATALVEDVIPGTPARALLTREPERLPALLDRIGAWLLRWNAATRTEHDAHAGRPRALAARAGAAARRRAAPRAAPATASRSSPSTAT